MRVKEIEQMNEDNNRKDMQMDDVIQRAADKIDAEMEHQVAEQMHFQEVAEKKSEWMVAEIKNAVRERKLKAEEMGNLLAM